MDTQGSQQQKIAEDCARIAQELAKEQKVPQGAVNPCIRPPVLGKGGFWGPADQG